MGEVDKSRLQELAEEINQEHQAFRWAFKATYRSALRAGDLLNEAKEEAGHGNWGKWVEENCEFSMRTAQVYMRIANNREEVEGLLKSADSALLSIEGVLTSIARSKGEITTAMLAHTDDLPAWRPRGASGSLPPAAPTPERQLAVDAVAEAHGIDSRDARTSGRQSSS